MNTLLKQVKANAVVMRDDALSLTIPNRSGVGSDTVTVADMAQADIARGNCWVTSNELYENLEFAEYGAVHETDIVGVEAEGLSHYAIYLTNETEDVVVDFTARQFSPDAPFPLIMEVDMWHAYMKHVTGNANLELAFDDEDDE